ncbi:DUF3093 domain-containing protein [Naumannella sp. ID2617S]|nr:DUF3093 domain-containing protein [Naumannella sp. ID2617S]
MSETQNSTHVEVLRVPLAWWLIAGGFLLSLWLAVGFYLGWWQGLLGTAALGGLVAWVLLDYGSLRVRVDADGFAVGRSRIEWEWVDGVRPLSAEETRRRQGPGADARAHLVLRPYLKRAVEVGVADPADPHPYWLVSCRDPDAVAAAASRYASTTAE